jgi:hypothetical protein
VARWILLGVLAALLIGCGGGGQSGSGPVAPPVERSATESGEVQRVVIRRANLRVRVESAEKALLAARNLATELGGYVESGGIFDQETDTPSAQAVLRVPEARFDEAIERLKALGTREFEQIQSEDVTLKATDLDARLKVLRAEERQYLELLAKARSVNDVLGVRQRLSEVRQQVESLDAQLKVIRNQAAYSTISVDFVQRIGFGMGGRSGWIAEAWFGAWNALFAVLRWLVQLAVVVVVFSVIWVPVVLLVRWSRNRPGRRPPPPPSSVSADESSDAADQ